ncbi:hypothetical protein PPYR_13106 [Photinus pyralis]|uniref:Protein sleepless n=1 Tax=Photinus pyralis TaxID=7054 RepID=A0A1Y1NBP5_PHOPY|nr:hypothetical protein PPYR_13106 [Photinus pyralis]
MWPLLVVVISLSCRVGQALDCYRCDSITRGFDTEIQLVDCKTLHNPYRNGTLRVLLECVQEQKVFLATGDNNRLCQQQNAIATNFQEKGKMKKCEILHRDKCNSTRNTKLTLVLNLIAFFIFYECTNY